MESFPPDNLSNRRLNGENWQIVEASGDSDDPTRPRLQSAGAGWGSGGCEQVVQPDQTGWHPDYGPVEDVTDNFAGEPQVEETEVTQVAERVHPFKRLFAKAIEAFGRAEADGTRLHPL